MPQPSRCELRAFHERRQLAVGNFRIHPTRVANECREAAIGPGNHPLAAHDVAESPYALRDEFGMLDVVGAGVDHAGDQHLVVRYFGVAPYRPLMRVAWVG